MIIFAWRLFGGADAEPVQPHDQAAAERSSAACRWSPHYGLAVYKPRGKPHLGHDGKWWKLLMIGAQIPPGAKSTTRSKA
jgi:hypothetical protein